MNTALLLLPDFSLILLGFVLYRYFITTDAFWRGLEQLVYFILFPALLFLSTATVKLDFGSTSGLVVASMCCSVLGLVLGYSARYLFHPDPLLFASGVQTAYRFNSYIALAVAGRLGGADSVALMAVLIAFNVPFCNIASVLILARHRDTNIWRELLRNPLIVATVSGLLFNFSGLHMPEFGSLFLTRLGNASIALGLLAVGAGLRLQRNVAEPAMVSWFIAVKQLALPAIAWLLAVQMELPPMQRQVMVIFTALPTASSAYILAVRMGGNGPIVAFLITAGTLLSLITLPIWLTLSH